MLCVTDVEQRQCGACDMFVQLGTQAVWYLLHVGTQAVCYVLHVGTGSVVCYRWL